MFLRPAVLLVLLTSCFVTTSAQAQSATPVEPVRPPNVVLILIDDMGVTDLGCQGSTVYQTPNIDRLAKEGMRFTNAYSACTVCSPTRAAVMTGKSPARLHITDWIAGHNRPFAKLKIPDWTKILPLKETTVAEELKTVGYTSASFGKWHLGNEGMLPTDQGFASHLGGHMNGQPPSYFSPYKLPALPEGPEGEYLTDRLTEEVLKYLDQRAKDPQIPFFVYLPHFTVHTPIQAKPELVAKYKALIATDLKSPHQNAGYAAMIQSLDDGVGRIRERLDRLGLSENTVVIFTSDNGGLIGSTKNPPYRAGKGSAYEGGVRVPFIAWGPGRIPAGRTESYPIISYDLFPTICAAAGVKSLPNDLDGVSIWPLLTGGERPAERALYWHYPHYHPGGATPYSAMRIGDERLIEFFEDGRLELYNLKEDIGEEQNLAEVKPARAKELHAMLKAWREKVGAQMPTPNPQFDPTKGQGKGKNKS